MNNNNKIMYIQQLFFKKKNIEWKFYRIYNWINIKIIVFAKKNKKKADGTLNQLYPFFFMGNLKAGLLLFFYRKKKRLTYSTIVTVKWEYKKYHWKKK